MGYGGGWDIVDIADTAPFAKARHAAEWHFTGTLLPVACCFFLHHSGAFPRFDRNLGNGEQWLQGTSMQVGHQQVFWGQHFDGDGDGDDNGGSDGDCGDDTGDTRHAWSNRTDGDAATSGQRRIRVREPCSQLILPVLGGLQALQAAGI